MAKFQKNPYLTALRELGATDYQIRVIRQLEKEFAEKDLYTDIAETNRLLLGSADRPVTLNYASAAAMARTGISVKEIIARYRAERNYIEKSGVSLAYMQETERMTAELNSFGFETNADEVRKVLNSAYKDSFFGYFAQFMHYKHGGFAEGTTKALRGLSVIFNLLSE